MDLYIYINTYLYMKREINEKMCINKHIYMCMYIYIYLNYLCRRTKKRRRIRKRGEEVSMLRSPDLRAAESRSGRSSGSGRGGI
ncbi:hypothetical protein LOK49_LG02G01245 [Camellia lanceoleosa]|uniref:Uncharacterized protein n=1 Tax=Camellia lanceoleosa TaxID=1840588 RepID=A0ACC0IQ91_9ERIC|nr:hypothetical protein LOK49_LG02G01245 [Camellia lanceoleosa]